MIHSKTIPSPIGQLTLASGGGAIVGLWLEGQQYFGGPVGPMGERNDLPIFTQAEDWLHRYFAGAAPDPGELLLAPMGSSFRQAVWNCLLQIPYGRVTTYGQIAKAVGCKSAQAVGGAVGHNPISILIPCHRVIGTDGQLTGYAGGLDKKAFLLELEQADRGVVFPSK